jgi:hypothetical protein
MIRMSRTLQIFFTVYSFTTDIAHHRPDRHVMSPVDNALKTRNSREHSKTALLIGLMDDHSIDE